MNTIDFSKLFLVYDTGYSLPVLIELKHPEKVSWYFTNDKKDIGWNGNLYQSVTMNYKFPSSKGGIPTGGSLEIDIDIQKEDGYELLRWFDESDDKTSIEVVGLINDQGEVTAISQLTQRFGSVTWDGKKITWNLGQEDRLNMQVNPWVADSEFLTG